MNDAQLLQELFSRAVKRQHFAAQRTIVTRARNLEAEVALTQLTVRRQRQMRILKAGNGATVDEIGKFWFTVGYSRIGGPDVIPLN